jgi:hypothetical protein
MKRKLVKFFTWDYGNGINGKCLWFRIYGHGLHFKKHDGMFIFSERYGYTPYVILFGVKIKTLKP